MTADFLISTTILVAAPGSGALYTLSRGLGGGPQAALVAALGCTLGTLPHLAAALSGLAALLAASPLAFEALHWFGVAYLAYVALGLWRADDLFRLGATEGGLVHPVLLNLGNPKLSLFFLAFLPQHVVPGAGSAARQMLAMSAVFLVLTFAIFAAYGLLAASLRAHVLSRPRLQAGLRAGFALAIAGVALDLARG